VIYPRNVNGTWISGRMNTGGKQNFQYGILLASIQAPDVNPSGLWPAFWTLGSDINTVPWPACGEADIMEIWPSSNGGAGTTGNNSTIHTADTGGSGVGSFYGFPNGEQNDNAFHTYGMIWEANEVQFFIDNSSAPFSTFTPNSLPSGDTWPFNAPLFTILNVAVGGNLGGSTSGLNPTPMIVDYVRYYTAQ
jgi:beta-glucanase (GH16 family)